MVAQLEKNHAIVALILGGIEAGIGLIVSIAAFVLSGKASLPLSLTPYWAGLIFIVPGIIGVITGITKNGCSMIAFMVLNIIAILIESIAVILLALVIAFWRIAASILESCRYIESSKQCVCNGEAIAGVSDCEVVSTIASVLTMLLAFIVIAVGVAFAGSILGCAAVCCRRQSSTGAVIMPKNGPMQGNFQPPAYEQK